MLLRQEAFLPKRICNHRIAVNCITQQDGRVPGPVLSGKVQGLQLFGC